jgi:hypothetical protein
MVSKHSRSPIARFTIALQTAEGCGAFLKFQCHPLLFPGRCRSILIPRNGDPYFIRQLCATAKGRTPFATMRCAPFSLSLTHSLTLQSDILDQRSLQRHAPTPLQNLTLPIHAQRQRLLTWSPLRPCLLRRLRHFRRQWLPCPLL